MRADTTESVALIVSKISTQQSIKAQEWNCDTLSALSGHYLSSLHN